MNIPLLEKIADHIVRFPKLFNMHGFKGCTTDCGTQHCIGGWACEFSGSDSFSNWAARKALELTQDQSDLLFFPSNDETFGGWYATAEQGAARIRHFIATNGTE
jgi:hypothetical protein